MNLFLRPRTALVLSLGVFILASCSKDDSTGSLKTTPTEEGTTPEIDKQAPKLTGTVRYEEAKMTAFNFEYPSTDPYGNPVTLSGAITIGDEVKPQKRARGLVLYNHFTCFRADQCPSRGDLMAQKFFVGSGLITISPDNYGFGATEDQLQAYCMSRYNGKASVDALLAAKKLLPQLGYMWNDKVLFNLGYSQGGQTTMGVVRHITENYPDLPITYSIAGGGSYDIPETYRQFIRSEISGMPSTVIHVLLTYNQYFKLGIPLEQIYQKHILDNLDEWILSMKYSRENIDERKIGTLELPEIFTPAILDLTSEPSQRFLKALDTDNLCHSWTPRKNEKILLVHHTEDITVPVENADNLYYFLREENGMRNVELAKADWGSINGLSTHDSGAIIFIILSLEKFCASLGILPWFDITNIKI